MFRWFFALSLLFSVVLPGTSQYKKLLHKTYAQRYQNLESFFYTNKTLRQDSVIFFKELDRLESLANQEGDEELLLEVRMLRNEYYMFGRQTNHALFLRNMLALKEEADKKAIRHLQVRVRQKLGYYYFYLQHKYGPGFDNYLSSYLLMKDLPVQELPEKQELVANIGTAYYQFGDFINARKFISEARSIAPSYKKRLPIHLTNTLGLIYRKEQQFDSADHYLWKAYHLAEKLNDSTWMGITAGNIGISYFYQKKYPEAVPLLEMDIRQSIKASEIDNAVTSFIILAKISLQNGHYLKAAKQIKQIREMLPETSNLYKHLNELYPLQARLYAINGDSARAFLYSDSAHFVKDSLSVRNNSILATNAERKIELEKHLAEVQRQEAEVKLQATIKNSLLAGIFLLTIIGLLVLNRQRIIHRQKQQKLEDEKTKIESELENATRQLNDFTNHIREKNKLIEQFSAEIERHQDPYLGPEQVATKEAHQKLLEATILTDDQWEEFRQLFNKVHVGYLQRLREKLPNLSPADTRYIVLSKLNLTSKEMASMLGVRPDAIRLYRHRLRKKLHIDNDKDLEDLVYNV